MGLYKKQCRAKIRLSNYNSRKSLVVANSSIALINERHKRNTYFLVIGILLVFIDDFSQDDRNKIPVDDQLLTQLSQAFEIQFDRKPNDEELTNLLINWYEDEILYQEALTKGFDSDDEIVRRRLIQKYNDFLRTQAFSYEPTEEELRTFYEVNLVRYMEPFNISFTHKFYKDKDSSEEDIFFSGDSFIGITEIKVNSNFGEGFFKRF